MNPEKIGRYEIIREIGRGGMATVFQARDPRFDRDVAIKALPREFLHDKTFLARFEREAKTIAALEHNAIVSVYDFGEEEGQPYLVMQYMANGSLTDRITEGPLPLGESVKVMGRVAEALDFAHSNDVVHRDVKPSNILFDRHDAAFLSDFGIVKVSEATAQLTGSGVIGTPAYMAPELAESGGVSPLIDVYALGVTLFQMLTGQLPYEADTPMGVMVAHMSKPIPNVRAFQTGLPPDVQAVIERVMAKDPMDRYPTAGEVAADLKAAATTGLVRRPAGWGGVPSTALDAATVDVLDELPLDDIDAAAIAPPVPRPAAAPPQAPPTPAPWPTPPEPRPLAPARPYADRRHDWMAYIALALGIISLCAWLLPVCGGTISVAGIILGALGIAKSSQRTVSIAGLVLSVLGLLGSIIYLILTVVIGVASAGY